MATDGGNGPTSNGDREGPDISGNSQTTWFLLRLRKHVRQLQFEQYVHLNRDGFIAREEERLERLVDSGVMPADRAAHFLARLTARAALPPAKLPSNDMLAAAQFVGALLSRQTSSLPDFTALYQRKQELDLARDQGTREPEL